MNAPYPTLHPDDFKRGKNIQNIYELAHSKADYFYVCNELSTGPSVRSRSEIFSMPFCNVCSYFKWNSPFTIYEAAKKQKGWIPIEPEYEHYCCPYCRTAETIFPDSRGKLWEYCPHCGKKVRETNERGV